MLPSSYPVQVLQVVLPVTIHFMQDIIGCRGFWKRIHRATTLPLSATTLMKVLAVRIVPVTLPAQTTCRITFLVIPDEFGIALWRNSCDTGTSSSSSSPPSYSKDFASFCYGPARFSCSRNQWA